MIAGTDAALVLLVALLLAEGLGRLLR